MGLVVAVDFDLDVPPFYPANSAIFPSAQADRGRQWNGLNQCPPNPGPRPPALPCTMTGVTGLYSEIELLWDNTAEVQ